MSVGASDHYTATPQLHARCVACLYLGSLLLESSLNLPALLSTKRVTASRQSQRQPMLQVLFQLAESLADYAVTPMNRAFQPDRAHRQRPSQSCEQPKIDGLLTLVL